MNLATQLQNSGLKLEEIDILIDTLYSNRLNIKSTLEKLSAYDKLRDAMIVIADAKEHDIPKLNPTFILAGKEISLSELQEKDKVLEDIIEKLKLIQELK